MTKINVDKLQKNNKYKKIGYDVLQLSYFTDQ